MVADSIFEYLGFPINSKGNERFLGASLNPDYFKEKVNLFIALAPVANTSHITSPIAKALAPHINLLEDTLVHVLGYRNWFAPMDTLTGLVSRLCSTPVVEFACKEALKRF